MLNGRRFAAACDEQTSKRSLTRRSGLVVKSEKAVYIREEYLPVVSLRKSRVALHKSVHQNDDPHENDRVQLETQLTSLSNTFAVAEGMMNDTSQNKIGEE